MDTVANALAKMKNAIARKSPVVELKKSGLVGDILHVLKKEGYILDYSDSPNNRYGFSVKLKYVGGKPSIMGMQKVSRLSRRIYVKSDAVPRVFNNLGISILTTSKGVLTDQEARALKVGGEILCKVW